MDGSLQLALIEFIRNNFIKNENENIFIKFFKVLVNLVKKSGSSAAKFESAITLISFSSQSETIKSIYDLYYYLLFITYTIIIYNLYYYYL